MPEVKGKTLIYQLKKVYFPWLWQLNIMQCNLLCFIVSGSISCNFDKGLCASWSQSKSDQLDWTVRSGSRPSSGTGPSSGHSGAGK